MKFNLELNNQTKSPIKKSFFDAVVKRTLKEVGFSFLSNKKISISIALVDKAEIKKFNRIYRKKNQVTDILSFAEYKNEKKLKSATDNPPAGGVLLGELVLCYDYIKKYAEKNKTKLDQELAKVVSHGVLHLLGFKHGKKMFGIQNVASGKY